MSGKAAPTSGIGIVAGVLALGMAVSVSAAPFAPEPAGLWPGPMQGATPRTLKNATVLDRPEMARLIEAKHPVLIDVANLEHEPAGRTPGLDWEPVHRTVPGAIWLPGAGTGHDAPGFFEAFAKRIAGCSRKDLPPGPSADGRHVVRGHSPSLPLCQDAVSPSRGPSSPRGLIGRRGDGRSAPSIDSWASATYFETDTLSRS